MATRSHVTKREAEAICSYAAEVMAALHMPAWAILVMEEPCDPGSEATIDWINQRYVAQLYLSPEWMKFDYDRRRDTVTHEVLHLLHAKVSTVVLDDSQSYMHKHEHKDWARRVRREFEFMVDHLAGWMARTHSLKQAWDTAHGRPS